MKLRKLSALAALLPLLPLSGLSAAPGGKIFGKVLSPIFRKGARSVAGNSLEAAARRSARGSTRELLSPNSVWRKEASRVIPDGPQAGLARFDTAVDGRAVTRTYDPTQQGVPWKPWTWGPARRDIVATRTAQALPGVGLAGLTGVGIWARNRDSEEVSADLKQAPELSLPSEGEEVLGGEEILGNTEVSP